MFIRVLYIWFKLFFIYAIDLINLDAFKVSRFEINWFVMYWVIIALKSDQGQYTGRTDDNFERDTHKNIILKSGRVANIVQKLPDNNFVLWFKKCLFESRVTTNWGRLTRCHVVSDIVTWPPPPPAPISNEVTSADSRVLSTWPWTLLVLAKIDIRFY